MKRRLILDSGDPSQKYRVQVTTDDEIRRSVSLIRAFMTWCTAVNNVNPVITEGSLKGISHEKLCLMLNRCEEAMSKSQDLLVSNQTEMRNYEILYAKIEAGIIDAHNKILQFKNQLIMTDPYPVQQNKAFGNKTSNIQNYQKMVVNGYHGLETIGATCDQSLAMSDEERKETLDRLTLLEMEVRKLQMIRDDLNRKLIKRRKQCETLVATAHELKGLFTEVTSSTSIHSISNLNYDETQVNTRNNNKKMVDTMVIAHRPDSTNVVIVGRAWLILPPFRWLHFMPRY